MYRVIIVDDEPWAIKGIRNSFNWSKNGFEIVGQFTSAHKAAEFINETPPDLVFTDIRMPEISGLDLIRMTKAKGLDVEFIIVSGFSEFTYAQEALRYGALDYFLKPMDIDRADPFIQKLASHFSKKKSSNNNLILEALSSTDKSELSRLTRFFEQPSTTYYRVLVVYSHSEHYHHPAFSDPEQALRVEFGSGKTLYFLKSKNKADLDQPYEPADFASPEIKAVGISTVCIHSDHMAKLIKESDLAASRIFVHEEKGVFEYGQNLHAIKPLIDEISALLHRQPLDEMTDIMDRILPFFKQHRLGMGEVVYLWNQVVAVWVGAYYEELKDMELDFLNYSELKERFENFESLCSFLSDIMTYLKQINRQPLHEGPVHSHFNQMVKYIDQNYQQKLYLKDLSQQFYINQVYCCQLFKKNLGQTFSEYVTDLRIKKACELLKYTELSIEDIAIEVGYIDYYYFNKVFKKQCGITPTKFRKY